jgi:hypothetical protein
MDVLEEVGISSLCEYEILYELATKLTSGNGA